MNNISTKNINRSGYLLTLIPIPKGEKGPKLIGCQNLTVMENLWNLDAEDIFMSIEEGGLV